MPGNVIKKVSGTPAESTLVSVKKGSVGTINKGQLVYVSGYDAADRMLLVELAKADSASTMPSLGFADGAISDSSYGYVVIKGLISGLNTNSEALRDELYVSPDTAGAYTVTKPTGVNIVEKVGVVVRPHASEGCIEVYGGGVAIDSAGNIAGYTEKTAPVSADMLVIEDSEASNSKKMIQIGNLPNTGVNSNLDGGEPDTNYGGIATIDGGTP